MSRMPIPQPSYTLLLVLLTLLFTSGCDDSSERTVPPGTLEGTLIYTRFNPFARDGMNRTAEIVLHDLKTGNKKVILHSRDVGWTFLGATSISRDGRTLIVETAKRKRNILVVDLPTLTTRVPDVPFDAILPRLSPSGTKLVFHAREAKTNRFRLWMYDLTSNSLKQLECRYDQCVTPVWGESDNEIYFIGIKNKSNVNKKISVELFDASRKQTSVIYTTITNNLISAQHLDSSCNSLRLLQWPAVTRNDVSEKALLHLRNNVPPPIVLFKSSKFAGASASYVNCDTFFLSVSDRVFKSTHSYIYLYRKQNGLSLLVKNDRFAHGYVLWHPLSLQGLLAGRPAARKE